MPTASLARNRLHYLFEENAGSNTAKRFVSFCTDCSCVLRVSKTLETPDRAIESMSNRCPGCGSALEVSIATHSMPVSQILRDAPLPEGELEPRRRETTLQSAQLLRRFRFGFPPLDALLEPIDPGWLAVFRGPTAGLLTELLCFRAQLSRRQGGMDSTCIFVDGGNCSDPLLFASLAKRESVNPNTALRKVITSRAFTIYQLANLLLHELPRAIDDNGSRLVVVSDALSMFADPSIPEREARRVADALVVSLRKLREQKDALVLVTLVTPTRYDSKIAGEADLLLDLHPDISGVRAELVKHPLRRPRSSTFRPEQVSSKASSAHQSMMRAFGKNTTIVQNGTVG